MIHGRRTQLSRGLARRQQLGRAAVTAVLWPTLLLAGSCATESLDPHDSLDAFTAHLDRRIPALMSQYDVPGSSVALVRRGELVWSAAYGYADLEERREMTVDAVARAESISKSVTAWAVMRLVEKGEIGLDDPVQRHLSTWRLPESRYSAEAVTVRRLLSGTAGMTQGSIGVLYAPDGDMPSLRDYLSAEAYLVQEPGSSFLYSNVGFNLLELLVEEVTGRDFAAYMADEVLAPLGMRNASFAWSEALRPAIPTGYGLRGDPVPVYVYPAKASGGLFASVGDIARFAAATMTAAPDAERAVLSPAGIRQIHTAAVERLGIFGFVADGYGFGHFTENLSDGRQAVWHGGQGTGWMTHFHVVPESGDAVVIVTNSQRSWPLMAQVLNDWARWSGFRSVKMGRIVSAVTALRVLIGVVLLASLWQLYRLARGVRSGDLRWAPLSKHDLGRRSLKATLGIGALAVLAWSAAQPYLMVSSIFPGVAGRAGLSFSGLALILVVSALFSRTESEP